MTDAMVEGGKKCGWCVVVKVLLIVGGLNWGLVGLGMLLSRDLNVVHAIFGGWAWLEAVIYLLVGIAALVKIFARCGCKCSGGVCQAK